MSRRPWTPDEDATITATERLNDVQLALQLGRTVNAIRTRRNALLATTPGRQS